MFTIKLNNNKSFSCEESSTIFSAAEAANILLEHSCLSGRCRSCMVKILEGKTNKLHDEFVLSEIEKKQGYILSCISKPLTDLKLDIEDLGDIKLSKSKTVPAKVDAIEKVTDNVIKVILRLPPSSNFTFIAGQYINVIKGNIKRSYSIANNLREDSKLELLIKKYPKGEMSRYWFGEAKQNDLIRIVGPLGTFFFRSQPEIENIVFLATGTGIAPVKAIIEQLSNDYEKLANKKIFIIWGGRYPEDIFFNPDKTKLDSCKFIPVLSRASDLWKGELGYVQEILLKEMDDFSKTQVYGCGSNLMIESAKKTLIEKGLPKNNFYSDAFVASN